MPYLLTLLVLAACKPGVPRQFIQPAEMEDILVDYHKAQAMAQNDGSSLDEQNYNRTYYFALVLKKYGVTLADFDSSMVYYFTRADRFEPIYKRVQQRLSDEAIDLGASEGEVNRLSTVVLGGDTTNVWEGPTMAYLIPFAPYNHLDYSLKADSSYHEGDVLMLTFLADFHYQNGSKEAVVSLNVKLDNDSVIGRSSHVSVSGNVQLRLDTPSDRVIKEIKGFVYQGKGNDNSSTLKLMFLNNIQLIRFHKREIKPVDSGSATDSLSKMQDGVSQTAPSVDTTKAQKPADHPLPAATLPSRDN